MSPFREKVDDKRYRLNEEGMTDLWPEYTNKGQPSVGIKIAWGVNDVGVGSCPEFQTSLIIIWLITPGSLFTVFHRYTSLSPYTTTIGEREAREGIGRCTAI